MKDPEKGGHGLRSALLMAAAALLCILVLLGSGKKAEAPTQAAITVSPPARKPLPAPVGLRIAVASDTHFDPDNSDKNGQITEEEIQSLLNVKRTRAFSIAKQMRDNGLIRVFGRGKNKRYIKA